MVCVHLNEIFIKSRLPERSISTPKTLTRPRPSKNRVRATRINMLQIRTLTLLLFILLSSSSIPTATAIPQLPAGANLKEDNGQVTINRDPTDNQTDNHLPIRATIFSGVPGPTHCRGHVVLLLDLPPPSPSPDGNSLLTTPPQCYNIPSTGNPSSSSSSSSSTAGTAGCGNFLANKSDGCEARVFAEPNCAGYLNTVVFTQEDRAVGGQWRSLEVRCGVPAPDPESLGKPPLAGFMGQARIKENKPGRRWVG
ncbi:uncharacterized protein B0T23DRAFT_147758 [Neurospora hispaniola]|uniref:Uncharacterized protein n=1 Tax=Neurospora hispaniola TaxID=588809 RepID=A0AAJ0I834_9PEZI|nr:hypothetical protein B0T23DRAFT_147758 [Neurospora hispaniola]